MEDSPITKTVAYRIVQQFLDHVYGSQEEVGPEDFLVVYRGFVRAGGSWEGIIRGDMDEVSLLEASLDRFLKMRNALGQPDFAPGAHYSIVQRE